MFMLFHSFAAEVLSLCGSLHSLGKLTRFDHISTSYVAGDRVGRVLETECDEGQGFRNSYEWSKCQSEKRVQAATGWQHHVAYWMRESMELHAPLAGTVIGLVWQNPNAGQVPRQE